MVTASINRQTNKRQVEAFEALMGMLAYYEECKPIHDRNTPIVQAEKARLGQEGLDVPLDEVLERTLVGEGKCEPWPEPKVHADGVREFYYGGAIRGGKTYFMLCVLVLLCRMYPGSRWHVVRASFTQLVGITESSLLKILGTAPVRWKRSTKDYYVEFRNGSRICFFSENYNADPQGTRFLGLETNGFLLEQMEELRLTTMQQCLQRAGSWYIPHMPPPLILGTFNPSFGWVKSTIYDPWVIDPEGVKFHYTPALPSDNTKVTREQWEQWSRLDTMTYQRMIRGIWEIDIRGRFFHAFEQERHIKGDDVVFYRPELPLWLSFDFNVDPSCCIIFQTDKRTFFHILDEVRIENGDTPAVCDVIRERYGPLDPTFKVTGDAAGLARMSGLRGHLSQYRVIQQELELPEARFELPETNPEIPDSRVFTNSIWARFPDVYVHHRCKYLIHDLNFVQIKRDEEGRVRIQKTGKLLNAPTVIGPGGETMSAESMGHLADASRYAMHTTLHKFVIVKGQGITT